MAYEHLEEKKTGIEGSIERVLDRKEATISDMQAIIGLEASEKQLERAANNLVEEGRAERYRIDGEPVYLGSGKSLDQIY